MLLLIDYQQLSTQTKFMLLKKEKLLQKEIINNSRKSIHRHKTVTSFCIGTKTLYDFVHKHPHVDFHPSEYVNNPSIIAQNDKMVSINSAIEVDLTGQVWRIRWVTVFSAASGDRSISSVAPP